MSLTAYIRYDHTGRIVPGGPIVVKDKPANGNWQPVTEGTTVTLSGKLRAFVKVDRFGKPIAGSLFLGKTQPATGSWIEVNATYEGPASPTTTTTTTEALLQMRWQNSMNGNSCTSTDYVYVTGNPDFCSAIDFYGDFSSIVNAGVFLVAVSDLNGNRRTLQVVDASHLTTGPFSGCANC